MTEKTMGVVEAKFADIIWEHEPISSSELWQLCEKEFKWKKTTTFTVLKRLCEKGIFQNENRTVTSLISREGFYAAQSQKFVEEVFEGSLPAFLAAFTSGKALSKEEIEELRKIVADYKEV